MNQAEARDRLSEDIAAAIMIAERRGMATPNIVSTLLGEMAIRPGYPKDFTAIYDVKYRVAFWDEFQHDSDNMLGDGPSCGLPFGSLEDAQQYANASWAETGSYDISQSKLVWADDGMSATASYLWEQGSIKKKMDVKYTIVKVDE
jgi:hypothetical protein